MKSTKRFGQRVILGARASVCCALVAGCDERLAEPPLVALIHDEAGVRSIDQDATRVVPPPTCEGACCPTDPACFPAGNPGAYSGAECIARRDNSGPGQKHWQFRQALNVSASPPGIRGGSPAATVLAGRSDFKTSACGRAGGTGGFMQLIDFDPGASTSRVGFAAFATDESDAVSRGLCFATGTYGDTTWGLHQLYEPPGGWPKGLPPPMPLPWSLDVVTAFRYSKDFALETDRRDILARFDPETGDLHQKNYNGIFFLDEATGYMHGYAPLAFILNYASATVFNAIPIRETEITMRVNDPKHPNCAGVFLGDDPAVVKGNCRAFATPPDWGCAKGDCGSGELAPAKIEGYFLTAELEQGLDNTLHQTYCSLFAGGSYPGWTTAKACRDDPKFDPTNSVTGLPPGDWCATTNAAATTKTVTTPECHDAWRSVSYSTFQGFPVRDGTCPAI